MNKNIKHKIDSYFSKDLPDPDMALFDQIKAKIPEQKVKVQNRGLSLKFRWLISCFTLVAIILPSILIANFFHPNKKITITPTEVPKRYYTSGEVNKIEITNEEINNYINDNFPKYSFIFDECNIQDTFKYEFEDNIVEVSLVATEKVSPLRINFYLITDNYYNYDDDSAYRSNAVIEEKEDYTLYYTELVNMYFTTVYELFKYENYRLYINFNYKDESVINKFL